MFGVCVEASHERGLGHLYRALNLIACFKEKKQPYVLLVNEYDVAAKILRECKVNFNVVPLSQIGTGWETEAINRYHITTWINDRLNTDIRHAEAIKRNEVRLVTFDDQGTGARLADLHVAALFFGDVAALSGNKVVTGTEYLILNRDIERFRRLRTDGEKILVTLGGTDTYGVTIKVVELLKGLGLGATIVIGPGFRHVRELDNVITSAFGVKRGVSSLAEEFVSYGLAFTGGGITAFEAAASGLPSIVVANEWFEVPNGKYLEKIGCSIFAGHHTRIDDNISLPINNLEQMSQAGLANVTTRGADNVYREIEAV